MFGRSHAANASGEIAINNIIAACRTINITSTTSKAKSRAVIVGMLTARNRNKAAPARANPPATKVDILPAAADWVSIPDAAPSRTPLREKPSILDKSTAN